MKITLQLKDLIYWAIIGVMLWLLLRNTSPDISPELERAKFERDSIVSAMIDAHNLEADKWQKKADSTHNYIGVLQRADSINKYTIRHERNKIPHYTPAQRSHAVDSILKSANIR